MSIETGPSLQDMGIESEKESPKIEFPQDLEVVRKMQTKLNEYRKRLAQIEQTQEYLAPEQMFNNTADTRYKIAIMERLLLDGSVDTQQLSRDLNEADGDLNPQAFINACEVIQDYAETGGQRTTGGTGLK